MQTYGTNSVYAVMRILTMANIVRRSIGETQMRELHDIAKAQKLTQDDMLRVVAEYEIDVAKAGDSGPFFNGDRSLPQVLVHGALNEIEGDCVEMWPFLIGQEDATDAVAKFVNDERWPVRIMANLTQYMLSISNGDPEQFSWNNENRDRRVMSEWLDQYREEDPDPTEP